MLQTRVHPSQQKLFDLLGTHCPPPSPVFFKFIHPGWQTNCGTGGGPPCHKMYTMLFIIPVWNTSSGMGGIPPSNNTVVLLCAVSFLLNHDPDLRIFSLYFRANDSRISCVCDDQYTATLERLEEIGDEAFKLYMKIQGWFLLWGCPSTSDTAASPAPCAPRRSCSFDAGMAASPAPNAAPGGAGASTPALPPPPPPEQPPAVLGLRHRRKTLRLCHRTTRVVLSSSRWSRATAIRRRHLDSGDVAIRRPGVGHTPSKTSRLQSAAFRSSPLPSSARLRNGVCSH